MKIISESWDYIDQCHEKLDVKLKEGRVRGINRFFIEMIFDRGGERSALGSFLEIVNTYTGLGLSSHHHPVLTVTIRGETQLSNSYQLSHVNG